MWGRKRIWAGAGVFQEEDHGAPGKLGAEVGLSTNLGATEAHWRQPSAAGEQMTSVLTKNCLQTLPFACLLLAPLLPGPDPVYKEPSGLDLARRVG